MYPTLIAQALLKSKYLPWLRLSIGAEIIKAYSHAVYADGDHLLTALDVARIAYIVQDHMSTTHQLAYEAVASAVDEALQPGA
jgi:hypothetical protein